MAEPLKNSFNQQTVRNIGTALSGVWPAFNRKGFERTATERFEALELLDRARAVKDALAHFLPPEFGSAADIIENSLDAPLASGDGNGMAPFRYLPYVFWVGEKGLNDFERAMTLQHALTQRFTCEFSIRPFLIHHTDKTLKVLKRWTIDPSLHVRRLVSEGSRPRLPWAPRLPMFIKDPRPILPLLEALKDDGELYVRRSVANNLNDIAKDHPEIATSSIRGWLTEPRPHRQWIAKHALRTLIKKGDGPALSLFGHGQKPRVEVVGKVTPTRVKLGERVNIKVTLKASVSQALAIDWVVLYANAEGHATRSKVFKGKTTELKKGQSMELARTLSLTDLTTRTHYPGTHEVWVRVNGVDFSVGHFTATR